MEDIVRLNADWLHGAAFDDVEDRLAARGTDMSPELWTAIRGNLETLADAALWKTITEGEISPVIEDPAFAQAAAALLPPEPWDETTWKTWTDAVKAETGAKGKGLFMPLRLALTGLNHGPELKALLPLIGRDKARSRLAGDMG